MTATRRLDLDFYRAIAIICVVADHTWVWLGAPAQLTFFHQLTIFSVVPLFFLAGVTFAIAYDRRPPSFWSLSPRHWPFWRGYFAYWWHKAHRLISGYALATALIVLYQTQTINLSTYWQQLITFPGPFYFILIYLELLISGPFICQFGHHLSSHKKPTRQLKLGLVWLVILLLSLISQHIYLFSPAIFLPGRQLLGGIELIVFASGIISHYLQSLTPSNFPPRRYWTPSLFLLGCFSLGLLSWSGGLDQIFVHPPSGQTLWYAASVGLILAACYQVLQATPGRIIVRALAPLGVGSMAIFLYHSLWLEILLTYLPDAFHYWPVSYQLISLIIASLSLSLLTNFLITHIRHWFSIIISRVRH